jgi:hypothetical protein
MTKKQYNENISFKKFAIRMLEIIFVVPIMCIFIIALCPIIIIVNLYNYLFKRSKSKLADLINDLIYSITIWK